MDTDADCDTGGAAAGSGRRPIVVDDTVQTNPRISEVVMARMRKWTEKLRKVIPTGWEATIASRTAEFVQSVVACRFLSI